MLLNLERGDACKLPPPLLLTLVGGGASTLQPPLLLNLVGRGASELLPPLLPNVERGPPSKPPFPAFPAPPGPLGLPRTALTCAVVDGSEGDVSSTAVTVVVVWLRGWLATEEAGRASPRPWHAVTAISRSCRGFGLFTCKGKGQGGLGSRA